MNISLLVTEPDINNPKVSELDLSKIFNVPLLFKSSMQNLGEGGGRLYIANTSRITSKNTSAATLTCGYPRAFTLNINDIILSNCAMSERIRLKGRGVVRVACDVGRLVAGYDVLGSLF